MVSCQTPPTASSDEVPRRRSLLLLYCFLGVMATFTLNGFLLEKLTKAHDVGEMTLTFVSCAWYAVVAYLLRVLMREPTSSLPMKQYVGLSLLTFVSTIASIYALRYVSFITRILGKSCKSIPVMLLGAILGKRYDLKKVLSVLLLSVGVAIFLLGTYAQKIASHEHDEKTATDMSIGCVLLLVSLLCDGATGAIEDKLIAAHDIHAFELMFYLSLFKRAWRSLTVMVTAWPHLGGLTLLSLTGASGQAVLFVTLRNFGALTTSIIGTLRKVVSIVLSVILFRHALETQQLLGLVVAFGAIGLNWLPTQRASSPAPTEDEAEVTLLLKETTCDDDRETESSSSGDEGLDDSCSATQSKQLDAVVEWDKTSSVLTVA
ncbi:hypothetical protein SPRG_22078 [Saprolegnia parasitica CBS 223.65]|uniref:Sugar phosphate transporter domain-containing protein n=1 Tax=Saprolegnia parasitica (strain CBS 223.65) TaxID=695850 RepID=A0A067CUC1_SAPPC|nr:hypothetical protein SPRG_22078 [Saprolegnia parasitica CBS 223.65]KDO34284.1 hypothetical protein SPRG_22078 [Saprolegnia parasitica CBS 223.65]|eukprot:XP_012195342.1 hypothetical protein SPRG_22078 [Saprolegnia parasitica CBS 223.65]